MRAEMKNWCHHWKLKHGQHLDFMVMDAQASIDTVHEFYNIGTTKKLINACGDNCPYCHASLKFHELGMKKTARTFKPKEYVVFNIIVINDEFNIADTDSVRVMKLPVKAFNGANFESGVMYRISRNGAKFEIVPTDEKYEISEEWLTDALNCEDYLTKTSETTTDDQFAFVMNSFRNTI